MRRRIAYDFGAAIFFALVVVYLFRAPVAGDLADVVPAVVTAGDVVEAGHYPRSPLLETDHEFVVWLVARNAKALVSKPFEVFDAETCFPGKNTLAFGEPLLSAGLLGIPAYLISGDPIVIYNWTLFAITWIAAFSMYWVIKSWTGLPEAGVIAGLLYGFHQLRAEDSVHFYIYDTSWTLLALFFAHRLMTRGRLRDCFGFFLATSMQLAQSLFPIITAAVVGFPFLVWLLWRQEIRKLPIARIAAVVVLLVGFALVLYQPYFSLTSEGVLDARPVQVFRTLPWMLPGGGGFSGWLLLGLVVVGLAANRQKVLPDFERDPRIALMIGALFVGVLAIGSLEGNTVALVERGPSPGNLYMALADWFPPMALIRGPGGIYTGVHLMLSLVAGLGAAALLRRGSGRSRIALFIGLGLLAWFETLGAPAIGIGERFKFVAFPLRPDVETLAFYEDLSRVGADGPLLVVPAVPANPRRESGATLLTAYHGRRSGQCYNSFHAPAVERVRELSQRLPEASAIREFAEMGFTTFVVELPAGYRGTEIRRAAFAEQADGPNAPLREVARTQARVAYDIVSASNIESAQEPLRLEE